jgi:streptomycin 6-kinase
MSFHRHFTRWSLRPEGEPLETPSSYIVTVQSPAGPAVLKLFKPPREEAGSPRVLAHYGGSGAVRVIAHDEEAMLMRRALPGTPLSDLVRAGHDDEATGVICDVAAALHARGAASGDWITVEDWGDDFGCHRRSARADSIPSALLDEAQEAFAVLCGTQSKRVLLHGDLHHDNILFDRSLGWLAIDPKGVLGEPEYELGAALRNPVGSAEVYTDPAVMERRVARMCARLGFEPARVVRWCFAQAVLSAVWLVQDQSDAADVALALEVATVSRGLMA